MILMECCGQTSNWQSLINAMPCLIKWLLVIVALIFLMKYLARLLELWTKNCHEKKMKEKSFVNEKWWHFQSDLMTDFEGALKKRTEELTQRIGQLEEEKKELARKNELEKERLQYEHDYYKKLLDDFYCKKDENK